MGGGAAARSLVGAEVSERDRLPVGSRSPQVAVRRDTRRASWCLLRARTAGIGTRCRGGGSWRRNSRLRRLLVAACFGMLASMIMAAAAVGGAHHFLLGRSVDGRPIVAYEVGDTDSQVRELVVGCIHGDECAGVAIAHRLERATPQGVDLWIVPVLNPDGAARDTRGNAHGVDLNRNFPWRWRPLSGLFYSGPRPLSEPESRIAYRLLRRPKWAASCNSAQPKKFGWCSSE